MPDPVFTGSPKPASPADVSGGWHEVAGSERPFSPVAAAAPDVTEMGSRRFRFLFWAAIIACVAGLVYLGFPRQPPAPADFIVEEPAVIDTAPINGAHAKVAPAADIATREFRFSRAKGTVASPGTDWFNSALMSEPPPPDEPLEAVADSLSLEWRIARGASPPTSQVPSEPPAPAVQLAAAEPQSTLRVSSLSAPSLAQRLDACHDQGFFGAPRCRAQVCEGLWGSVPECPDPTSAVLP